MPPGSDRTRLAVPWSRVIQKSTQSTRSKCMIWRVKMVLSAKKTAEASAAICPASSGARPGWATMTTPTKPMRAAKSRVRVSASPRRKRREQRHPDRIGELERHELAERDQRHREEPQVLAGVVEEVALEMQGEMRRSHLRKAGRAAGDGEADDGESDERAVEHELEGVHAGQERPPRDGHRHEGHDGAHHPGGGFQGVRVLHGAAT